MILPRPIVHGVYVLCYLSRQSPDAVIPAKDVAAKMGVPPEQASKILQSLASAGMVNAFRGRQGGYSLTRSPAEITLADICNAICEQDGQERLQARECPETPTERCSAHHGLMRLHEEFWKLLRNETLASVVGMRCKSAPRIEQPSESQPSAIAEQC